MTTAVPALAHIVEVTDAEGHSTGIRAFATPEAAETYAAEWRDAPDNAAHVYHLEVASAAPRVIRYMEVGFAVDMHRKGLRWWAGDLTEDNVHIAMVAYVDEDHFPDYWKNVPVFAEHTKANGLHHFKVGGTDEARIRSVYVRGVRDILAIEGER